MSAKKKQILFISTRRDTTIHEIQKSLEARGYQTIYFKTDLIAKGYAPFSFTVSNEGVDFIYDGQRINADSIGAAWQRKPIQELQIVDKAGQESMRNEIRCIQDGMWDIVSDECWLNRPSDIKHSEYKVRQLLLARQLGFTIPTTVVSNRWGPIRNGIEADPVILKMAVGSYHEAEIDKILYTTVVPKGELPVRTNPFPGIWQPFVGKKREWRVTVVGKKVFPASIYTDKEASSDWRRLANTSHVAFKNEPFPEKVSQMCVAFLEKLRLRYGAFDFIEDADGKLIFLEMNPGGQYMWLERSLGLPISEAIAEELIAIAEKPN